MKRAIAFLLSAAFALIGCSAPPDQGEPDVAPVGVHRPTCAVDMTQPVTLAAGNFFSDGPLTACNETRWDGVEELRFLGGGVFVILDIDSQVPGYTYDLAQGGAYLQSTGYVNCEQGTVDWVAGGRDWEIDVDASCDDGSMLVAKWHGHVYIGND